MSLAWKEILKATLIGLLIACAILGAFVGSMTLLRGEFTVDVNKFDAEIEWGEEVNLEGINIIDNRTLGLVTTPLTKDMIVSIEEAEHAGRKKIVFMHNNKEFTVYFDVKFRVEFMSNGELIDTQLVSTSSELVAPTAKPRTGYEFSHWDFDFTSELTQSIKINAVFKEIDYPSLDNITAEYGDILITLSTCEYTYTNGRFVVVAKKIIE